MSFDPSGRAPADSGIFGLPFSAQESKIILIPVPWEATTSYGSGTSEGPAAILEASHQIDLYDLEYGKAYEAGFHLLSIPKNLYTLNKQAKLQAKASRSIEDQIFHVESKAKKSKDDIKKLTLLRKKQSELVSKVNQASEKVNEHVYKTAQFWLEKSKTVALIGGDHSTPFGIIKAVSEKLNGDFGILHIDAHHDLRDSYEGFQHSHASIFHNVMESNWAPKSLVQVGIRDFSEDESLYAKAKGVHVFYDLDIQKMNADGKNWSKIAEQIISKLPTNVYISFDIDGLSPSFCPHTGTPVPGGLDYSEVIILISKLKAANKKIVGFDLNEVAPGPNGDEWDANVAARLLYKLCSAAVS